MFDADEEVSFIVKEPWNKEKIFRKKPVPLTDFHFLRIMCIDIDE